MPSNKSISPFDFQKEDILQLKPIRKGNNTISTDQLTEIQMQIVRTVGKYGTITRKELSLATQKDIQASALKQLCLNGMLNQYSKKSRDNSNSLSFYALCPNKETKAYSKKCSLTKSEYSGTEMKNILELLSVNMWHIAMLHYYRNHIIHQTISDTTSIIQCRLPHKIELCTFVAMRYFIDPDNPTDPNAISFLTPAIRKYERFRLLSKQHFFVIITNATGGQMEYIAKSISTSSLASYPILITSDLAISTSNPLEWLYLYSNKGNYKKRTLLSL